MKTLSKWIVVASVLFAAPNVYAQAPHGHDHDAPVGGPKGGRLLENTEPRAEFTVEKDRTVTITFYDDAMKPVAVTEQSVTVIAETNKGKTKIDFEKEGDMLASKAALPEGNGYNLVIQFKQSPEAKQQNFRLKLDTAICGKCQRAEYACICHE